MVAGKRFRDRTGREVVLTEDAIRYILDGHRDMADCLAEIRPAVEAPNFVNRSARFATREIYYRLTPSGHC